VGSSDIQEKGIIDHAEPSNWKYVSPTEPGFHAVITPETSNLKATWIYRLNLGAGESYRLASDEKEMNAGCVAGEGAVIHGSEKFEFTKLDSFYLPGGEEADIIAVDNVILYIGASFFEGTGSFFFRRFDPNLPLGEVHQVHGEPPFEREVFMTLNQETPASRMINGFTWGNYGAWTSWPPHQHTADLEEVYCYYDLPEPRFALHLSSRVPGIIEAVHPVSSGDCVVVPEGYHPTVGAPGCRSSYFWVMSAHSQKSRRYDLAKADFGL